MSGLHTRTHKDVCMLLTRYRAQPFTMTGAVYTCTSYRWSVRAINFSTLGNSLPIKPTLNFQLDRHRSVLPSGIRFRTSSEIKAVQKALSNSHWRHIFSRNISMDSALDMRDDALHVYKFTFHHHHHHRIDNARLIYLCLGNVYRFLMSSSPVIGGEHNIMFSGHPAGCPAVRPSVVRHFQFCVTRFLCTSLVSITQQTSTSTSTSGASTSTSTVHKLSALSYIAVAQRKSCGIFHI